MGKTGKWLRNLLKGKKDREKHKGKCTTENNLCVSNPSTPIPTTPKEKRRWSFRRSSASAANSKELNFAEASVTASSVTVQAANNGDAIDVENEREKHAMAVAAATEAAAEAAVAAAQAAAAVISLTSASNGTARRIEEAAAIKIQSVFRSYLARKAMCALRGLVKLQALVRGHLVRKHATETLRCMQALFIAQARARAQRVRMASEGKPNQKQSTYRKTTEDNLFRPVYNENERGMEENIKIVEMDVCESKGYNSRGRNNRTSNNGHNEQSQHRFSTYYSSNGSYTNEENYRASSPAPSALTEFSPRSFSGHFDDYFFGTAQSSPHYYSAVSREEDSKPTFGFPRSSYAESLSYDYPYYPNYMANTESSRAKARSHSAPKQRPESYERQPSRRRASVEGRNVPRPVRMQRSSSHVGLTAQNYQYPWSIKLDRSTVSHKDSDCGSACSVLTNSNYCTNSLVAYE